MPSAFFTGSKKIRFSATHVNRNEAVSLLTGLNATKFALLSIFTVIETNCPRSLVKPLPKNVKSPLPFSVRC